MKSDILNGSYLLTEEVGIVYGSRGLHQILHTEIDECFLCFASPPMILLNFVSVCMEDFSSY